VEGRGLGAPSATLTIGDGPPTRRRRDRRPSGRVEDLRAAGHDVLGVTCDGATLACWPTACAPIGTPGGGIRTFRKPDGTSGREYLDVGENPPNGAIVHYWLDEGISGPVSLAFYDEGGTAIASFRSDDSSSPAAKRPSVRPGLNRFVWDLKYPGPETLDLSLAPPRNKPLAEPPDPPAGPTVVPGRYRVELSLS